MWVIVNIQYYTLSDLLWVIVNIQYYTLSDLLWVIVNLVSQCSNILSESKRSHTAHVVNLYRDHRRPPTVHSHVIRNPDFFYINFVQRWGRRGRDCMGVGYTTTCAISAYHH